MAIEDEKMLADSIKSLLEIAACYPWLVPEPPISREDLKKIFKRFCRGDAARAMNGGYGLGLSIAESLVEAHKGKIWAESQNGNNTFFIQLPTQ